ncbi:ABC transporter substrate-binding protein [Limnochorda pilosa]|uniref:ABC transporter substrate-binding protein n=1 Tax=Limnochorda pilosa TaxID=1555112 RepID=A0A0K2SH14_LIMPI|nr:extracellular solute-binding protein [Limnochorda pilosa]BAS26322.1 ABC transporter substrate-binding protein [Limnochorda pilosa]
MVKLRKWGLLAVALGAILVLGTGSAQAAGLVYSGWLGEEGQARASVQYVIERWNQEHPDQAARWEGWPFSQALNQMILRYNSGAPVDTAHINTDWLPVLVGAGALVDLRTVLDPAVFETFDPAALGAGTQDGVVYGLPRTIGSIAMISNPELLQKAGISRAPRTVKEFEAALAALRKADPDVIPYAFATDVGTLGKDFQMWLWTFGGRVFGDDGRVTIDGPEGVAALSWLKERVDRGEIAVGLSRFDARTLFANRRVGFYDDAVVAKGILRNQSGVASDGELLAFARPMARPVLEEDDPPAHLLWGHLLVVFDGPNAKAAARFAALAASTDAALVRYRNEGVPPATREALAAPEVKDDAWISGWVPALTRTARPAETEAFAQKAALEAIIAEEVQGALTGQKSVERALRDASRRLTEATRSK